MTPEEDPLPIGPGSPDSTGARSHRIDAMAVGRSIIGPGPMEPAPEVPGYEIIRFAGRGGLGVVWQARRLEGGREVALKLPHGTDPELIERLTIEADTLRALHHPHIVELLDFTESSDGTPVLVMEWMDGPNLATQLPDAGFDFDHALQIFLPVLEAVAHAHEHGVIHRDLKPSNILLDSEGSPKVSDFGLARSLNQRLIAFSMTRSGAVAGTVEYLAPECYRPDYEPSTAADMYALGILLYELLSGTPPRGAWQPLSQRKPLDVRLDELISQIIFPEPAKRPASPREIKQRLIEIRDTRPRLAGSPLVTPAVRAMDFAWTLLGLYLCGASYCATLSQTRTPVPALFDMTFGTEGLKLRGFLAVWALSLGIGLLSLWQIIRLWRFRQVPMRESLPQPFGAKLGHTRLAAGLVGLSQLLIFVLPTLFTLTVLFHSLHWRTAETAVWQSSLVITPWMTDEAVSPWRWDPSAFFDGGAYWLKEAQEGFTPGTLRVFDKTSFFVCVQPGLMVLAATITGAAMLTTFLMVVRQWWPRRRRDVLMLPVIGGLGLAVLVRGWRLDATIPQRDRARPGYGRANLAERTANLAKAFTIPLMQQLVLHEKPPLPMRKLAKAVRRSILWMDQPNQGPIEIMAWAAQDREASLKANRAVEALGVSCNHSDPEVDWTRSFAVHQVFLESNDLGGERIAVNRRRLIWSGPFRPPNLLRVDRVEEILSPVYIAESRPFSEGEAQAWLEHFLTALTSPDCQNLEAFFNSLLMNLPGTGLGSPVPVIDTLRQERRRWQSLTFTPALPMPPPTAGSAARWHLAPILHQSGIRPGRSQPEAVIDFTPQFDLAFISGAWRIVCLRL